MTARQADDAVRIASLDQRGDLGVRAPGRFGTDLDHAQYAETALQKPPAVDDANEKIAGKEREGAPLGADLLWEALGRENLETRQRDAFDGKSVVIADGPHGGQNGIGDQAT